MATKTVKQVKKDLTIYVKKKLPLTKDQFKTISTISAFGYSAYTGEINTKKLKNLDYKFENGKIRFDSEYNWKTDSLSSEFRLIYRFD